MITSKVCIWRLCFSLKVKEEYKLPLDTVEKLVGDFKGMHTCTAKKGGQYGPVFCPYFPQRRYSVREIYGITTGTVDARNGNKLHGRARREPSISPFYTEFNRRFSRFIQRLPVDFSQKARGSSRTCLR